MISCEKESIKKCHAKIINKDIILMISFSIWVNMQNKDESFNQRQIGVPKCGLIQSKMIPISRKKEHRHFQQTQAMSGDYEYLKTSIFICKLQIFSLSVETLSSEEKWSLSMYSSCPRIPARVQIQHSKSRPPLTTLGDYGILILFFVFLLIPPPHWQIMEVMT